MGISAEASGPFVDRGRGPDYFLTGVLDNGRGGSRIRGVARDGNLAGQEG